MAQTKMYCLTVLEVSPASSCQQSWFLPRAMRQGSAPASLFGLQVVIFSLYLHMVFSIHVHVCVLISSPYKDFSHIRLGPTLTDLIQLFKDPTSKYSHYLRQWVLGLQQMNLWGRGETQFSPKHRHNQKGDQFKYVAWIQTKVTKNMFPGYKEMQAAAF